MHKTIQCHVCKMPYLVYMHTVADQSACPVCVRKAERRMNRRPTREIMPDAAGDRLALLKTELLQRKPQ